MLTKKQVAFLESLVDVYPDYPKEGVSFKDLSPLYTDPYAMKMIADDFSERLGPYDHDCVIGCDARGFILGTLLAQKMGLPLVLARKPGKLPGEIISKKYDLEYGTAELQMHQHIIKQYHQPIIADDVLATGGTAIAVGDLMYDMNIKDFSFAFISEVSVCGGRDKIKSKFNIRDGRVISALKA